MKKLFPVLIFICASCNPTAENRYKVRSSDSGVLTIDPIVKQHMVDSMVNNTLKNAYLKDTVSSQNAPVKVISARPVEKEYSNYKDIRLVYKNTSGKTISAIKFSWYGLNAFGEPADMGVLSNGIGGGFTDDKLRPGKTDNGTWNILSRDLKKVVKAWPIEVVFEDGTKWKSAE